MTDKSFPAFPTTLYEHGGESDGMTLRDYFAAEAMSEMTWVDKEGSARECYEMADAMLKARK